MKKKNPKTPTPSLILATGLNGRRRKVFIPLILPIYKLTPKDFNVL
jgi:hypothetical protein